MLHFQLFNRVIGNMQIHNKDKDFHLYKIILIKTKKEILFCIFANEEKDIYQVYKRDENGYIKFNKDMNPITEIKKGKIKILKREE